LLTKKEGARPNDSLWKKKNVSCQKKGGFAPGKSARKNLKEPELTREEKKRKMKRGI